MSEESDTDAPDTTLTIGDVLVWPGIGTVLLASVPYLNGQIRTLVTYAALVAFLPLAVCLGLVLTKAYWYALTGEYSPFETDGESA